MQTPDLFSISLAQWSLHRTIFAGELDPLDFAALARNEFNLDAVEYVNTFFKDRAEDETYLRDLKRRADDHGVTSVLIMIDREGDPAHADRDQRADATDRHEKWMQAAAFLGCHSIRVNVRSEGPPEVQHAAAVDGLARLVERAEPYNINILVENHGGLSSNGQWLAGVIRAVGHPRCGTLPDFGNFFIGENFRDPDAWNDPANFYDRYQGVAELMPFAKGVSAKSNDFDAEGNDTRTDYLRMMRIVLEAGYHGYVGIEYEGGELPETLGIRRTQALLERVRVQLHTESLHST